MPTCTVKMLGQYQRDKEGIVMVLIAASAPSLDNYVELWDRWPVEDGEIRKTVRMPWDVFEKEWTLVEFEDK